MLGWQLTVSSPSSALLLPMVSEVEHMSGVTLLPPSRQLLSTLRQSSTGWGSSHSNTRPTSLPCPQKHEPSVNHTYSFLSCQQRTEKPRIPCKSKYSNFGLNSQHTCLGRVRGCTVEQEGDRHLQDLCHISHVVDWTPCNGQRGLASRAPGHAEHVADAVGIPIVALACTASPAIMEPALPDSGLPAF